MPLLAESGKLVDSQAEKGPLRFRVADALRLPSHVLLDAPAKILRGLMAEPDSADSP